MKIWELKPPGTLWATPGLLWDSFTFFNDFPRFTGHIRKMPLPFPTHLAVTTFATYKAIKIHVLPNVSPYILVKSGIG
jgi:hypothetical protein